MRAKMLKLALLPVLAIAVFAAVLAALAARPAAALDEASGLYSVEAASPPYRWTSNRVSMPLYAPSRPKPIVLTFGPSSWPGRQPPIITLATDQGPLASFAAPDRIRRYRVLAPPGATRLSIETTVDRPPTGDRRWLGVALYGLASEQSGISLLAAAEALGLALAAVLIALVLAWSVRRGYGIESALFMLALALGLIGLSGAPPGWRPDEVVSQVDAWNLAHTGRDHLGHLLPLGAFEAFGDWISPLLTYLELPSVALLGPQPLAGRLVTVVFGALAAPLCYRLAGSLGIATPGAVCAGLVALSPWQIFMNRTALPPALVPTSWALCLLVAIWFIQRGGRRDALALALAAGLALYAYPTMKLAVPLLVALAALLALIRHGWRAIWRWLPAALLAGVLWLPFAYVTLFNPASSTRLGQAAIQAGSPAEWLAAWWNGYKVYFQPDFYYSTGDGSPIRGVPGYGAELLATAPLVVLGLFTLVWRIVIANCKLQIADSDSRVEESAMYNLQSTIVWWFILGAIVLAPLPASLTQPSPHFYRAATIAPLYALLAGLGVALIWSSLARVRQRTARRAAQATLAIAFAVAMAWQFGLWYRDYLQRYPRQQARENQDGLLEAMQRLAGHANGFEQRWISYDDINEPYIYLLAARPLPPAELQQQIAVSRQPGHFNDITHIGAYRFVDMEAEGVRDQLPTLEAIPDQFGGAGYVIQRWQKDGQPILILRRMK